MSEQPDALKHETPAPQNNGGEPYGIEDQIHAVVAHASHAERDKLPSDFGKNLENHLYGYPKEED